jgi:hypothetical protein
LREAIVGLLMDRSTHACALKKLPARHVSPSEEINE